MERIVYLKSGRVSPSRVQAAESLSRADADVGSAPCLSWNGENFRTINGNSGLLKTDFAMIGTQSTLGDPECRTLFSRDGDHLRTDSVSQSSRCLWWRPFS